MRVPGLALVFLAFLGSISWLKPKASRGSRVTSYDLITSSCIMSCFIAAAGIRRPDGGNHGCADGLGL